MHIIAFSAGTGVAVWACEALRPPGHVHSLILLGSSLSHNYEMTEALANISGGVYVYHSPEDAILTGPVTTLGTIDSELGVESAGIIGLHPKRGDRDRIYNTEWSTDFEKYGWQGGHTDPLKAQFVREVLAQHIVPDHRAQAVTIAHETPPPPDPHEPSH